MDFEEDEAILYVDLNGDSKEDLVSLTLVDGSYDEYILKVNDATIHALGNSIEPVFNIVDIDRNDRYKEIAVSEYGPSSDHATTFYYYNGEEIIVIGTIQGFYGTAHSCGGVNLGEMIIDGSGVISTRSRGAILQTWFYPDEYRLSTERLLVNIPKELYEMNTAVEVLHEIDLQKSRTDATIIFTLTVGEKATIISSDNIEWCSVRNSKGETGWFAVDSFDTIRGLSLPAYEVFSGLCYAD